MLEMYIKAMGIIDNIILIYIGDALESKFEKTRLLSTRSLQIADNAPPQVDANKSETPYEVALKEHKEKKIPLKVIKYKTDGTRE